MIERRPRQYAAQIMGAPKNERKALFDKVPEHLQGMVRDHCQRAQDSNRMRRKRKS